MTEQRQPPPVKRLLSGIRPHGPLHLGQYVGVLKQWLDFQREYECYFMIADVQALALYQERPGVIAESVREVALDWLAVGLDPARSHFVVQSQIPELAELTIYLQMLVRTGELRDNPTLRDEARWLGRGHLEEDVDEVAFGLLAYPVSQVADMLLFTTTPPRAGDSLLVPVGEDQVPHVEFAREVARRFNRVYGEVFLEPEARTARVPRLPGTDGGSTMGRSRRNAIFLRDPEAEYTRKIRGMFSDPLRVRSEDPGHPDTCPCFSYYRAFGWSETDLGRRFAQCLEGRTECGECKEELVAGVKAMLDPIQERRAQFEEQPKRIEDALTDGTARGRQVAIRTIGRIREAMQLTYPGLLRRTPC